MRKLTSPAGCGVTTPNAKLVLSEARARAGANGEGNRVRLVNRSDCGDSGGVVWLLS